MGVEVRRRGDDVARERQGDGAARSDRWCGERGGERAPCRGTDHGGARGDANVADPSTGNVRGAHIRATPVKGSKGKVRKCCASPGAGAREIQRTARWGLPAPEGSATARDPRPPGPGTRGGRSRALPPGEAGR